MTFGMLMNWHCKTVEDEMTEHALAYTSKNHSSQAVKNSRIKEPDAKK